MDISTWPQLRGEIQRFEITAEYSLLLSNLVCFTPNFNNSQTIKNLLQINGLRVKLSAHSGHQTQTRKCLHHSLTLQLRKWHSATVHARPSPVLISVRWHRGSSSREFYITFKTFWSSWFRSRLWDSHISGRMNYEISFSFAKMPLKSAAVYIFKFHTVV